jgi:hypothetical protein
MAAEPDRRALQERYLAKKMIRIACTMNRKIISSPLLTAADKLVRRGIFQLLVSVDEADLDLALGIEVGTAGFACLRPRICTVEVESLSPERSGCSRR